jgi:hypothetical protein
MHFEWLARIESIDKVSTHGDLWIEPFSKIAIKFVANGQDYCQEISSREFTREKVTLECQRIDNIPMLINSNVEHFTMGDMDLEG